jgi:hypothetical protein
MSKINSGNKIKINKPETYDADYNTVTVTFHELLHVSSIAVRLSKDELHRELQAWYDPAKQGNIGSVYIDSMLEKAQFLHDATMMYEYLKMSESRSNLRIVGRK